MTKIMKLMDLDFEVLTNEESFDAQASDISEADYDIGQTLMMDDGTVVMWTGNHWVSMD